MERLSRSLRGEDKLTLQFRVMLGKPAGLVVVQDRVAKEWQQLRRQAQRNSIENYIQTYFIQREGKYHLKPGQEIFHHNILEEVAAYKADLGRIRPEVVRIAEKLENSGKLHEDLGRFFRHESGPDYFYTIAILPRLRPGRREFERVYGRLLVRGPRGEYFVPEGRMAQARTLLQQSRIRSEALKVVQKDVQELSLEIAEVDALHLRLKKASRDRLFVGILVEKQLKNRNPKVMVETARNYYEEALKTFRKTEDGLVLRDKAREKLEKFFQKYDRMKKLLPALRLSARDFISRVRSGDEVHDTFRTLLSTELSLMFVADRLGNLSTNADEALRVVWESLLEETSEGGLCVKKGAERQCRRVVRTAFNRIRGEARVRKKLDGFAGQIADEELRALHQSSAGKYVVAQVIYRLLEKREFDAFTAWKERSFRTTKEGIFIRDSTRRDLEKMIREVEEIEREAEKDDF